MSRITQQLAKDIAKLMVASKQEKSDKLKKEISEKTRHELSKSIPKEVKSFYEKFPKFTKTFNHVCLSGNGLNRNYVDIENLPSTDSYTKYVDVSSEFGMEVSILINKKEKLDKDIDTLFRSIENALLQLRTFKNVRSSFPEAAEHLPPDDKPMLPSLNLDVIRQQFI